MKQQPEIDQIRKGRLLIFGVFGVTFLGVIVNTVFRGLNWGSLFSLLLCFLIYRGAAWARMTLAILMFLGSVVLIIFFAIALSSNRLPIALLSFGVSVIYAVCGAILTFSSSVQEFLYEQNLKYR
jgi:hypothetical protein